jgi:hypothetical protein
VANLDGAHAAILHQVLVSVRLIVEDSEVQDSEVLHQVHIAILFYDRKDGVVVASVSWLDDPKFEPFQNMPFNPLVLGIWDLELLDVDQLGSF